MNEQENIDEQVLKIYLEKHTKLEVLEGVGEDESIIGSLKKDIEKIERQNPWLLDYTHGSKVTHDYNNPTEENENA